MLDKTAEITERQARRRAMNLEDRYQARNKTVIVFTAF